MRSRAARLLLRALLAVSLLLNAVVLGVVWRAWSVADELGFERNRLPRPIRQEFMDGVRDDAGLLDAARALNAARAPCMRSWIRSRWTRPH